MNKSSSFDNTQLQNQQAKQMLLVQKSIILKAMNEFGLGNAWTEILKNYEILQKIGEGSYGQVYKATCLKTK